MTAKTPGPTVASTKAARAKAAADRAAGAEEGAAPPVIEAGEATYTVTLPEGSFEGPLDLLLHLCQKHELDILDIPISFITEKYLEYLAVMQLMSRGDEGETGDQKNQRIGMHLDVASEYLLMAATLAHIKSKMLLPAPPPGQEDDEFLDEEDPREALIKRLLEYQKYKQAAVDLAARGVAGRDVFPRGVAIEEAVATGLAPLAEVPLYSLLEAFQAVLARSKVKLSHDVVADRISITDRIHELADLVATRKRMLFEDLFNGLTTRFDLVITFLALLEMTRLRMTRLFQTDSLSPLYIESTGDDSGLPEDIS
jgi:segregation and condensation protein A